MWPMMIGRRTTHILETLRDRANRNGGGIFSNYLDPPDRLTVTHENSIHSRVLDLYRNPGRQ